MLTFPLIPRKVIAYREEQIAGIAINAHNVDCAGLLNGHALLKVL